MEQYLHQMAKVIDEYYSDIASYSMTADGDPDYPFVVCPVGRDGIDMGVIARFAEHGDALKFRDLKCAEIHEEE